jgi:hypothetical protein
LRSKKGENGLVNISIDVNSLNFYDESISSWNLEKGIILFILVTSNNIFKKNENLNQIIINGVILEENSCNLSNNSQVNHKLNSYNFILNRNNKNKLLKYEGSNFYNGIVSYNHSQKKKLQQNISQPAVKQSMFTHPEGHRLEINEDR